MAFYPSLSPTLHTSLEVVLGSMRNDPDYLNRPECPFPTELKAIFLGMIGSAGEAPRIDDPKDMERHVEDLIWKLDRLEMEISGRDLTEKLSYFKNKASLIDKLIGFKERVVNIRAMAEFQSVLLGFLDEICSKDQVSELMLRLRHIESVKA